MKRTNPLLNSYKSNNKEAITRIKMKEIDKRIENHRIERLVKKPLSIEEKIISGNFDKK